MDDKSNHLDNPVNPVKLNSYEKTRKHFSDIKAFGFSQQPSVIQQNNDSFLKYTAGFDYTFPGFSYINLQWMHGFFTEQTRQVLHNYLFARWEHKWLGDQLQVNPGAALETSDLLKNEASYGIALLPEVEFRFIQNLELSAGAYLLNGERETLLGQWKNFDQAFVRAKIDI